MEFVNYIYGNGPLNEIIRGISCALRLYYPYNIITMNKMRNSDPLPQTMIDSQEFFSLNKDRVDTICGFLSDERSIDTYLKLISMRQYYREEDIPQYNYFDQYFPSDLPEFSGEWGSNEVFVDCGAFNGDITKKYADKVKEYAGIYAFEPDKRNISQLKKRGIRNLLIVEAACSDHIGEICFSEEDTPGGSHVINGTGSKNTNIVQCTTIDSVIGDGFCSFIKMDIEGAEWEALHGASETIKRERPKLAISIYHSNEDMIRLIEYIHELVPEYRLYVRAHTMGIAETILYAMV